ncbi:hypothetical protein BDV96DRAFT_641773 [Lophiotrema nucula]|uniref:Uncharacterized protein n=1 Tax=Lophiotrema nucula TaxID=690887 RepID=A0A6A5ZJX9_9PLEO|nr:hypothetical protein BDV96DRAFT_641773 [Lophiotrema nucula]
MSNPDTAISDDNIAAVLSMCMYENLRGSNLLMTHLRGLRQMVDMRGGINNLPADQGQHLSENIVLQDLIHATCSNVPPFLIDIYGPILRDVRGIGTEPFYPQSPLRVIDTANFDGLDPQLQSSFQVLKDAFDGLEMLCIEAFDPDTAADEAAAFKIRRDAFWTRLQQSEKRDDTDEVPGALEKRVEEAVRLAATIHFRAVALRIQHGDEANATTIKRLHMLVRKIDRTFWKIAPYTYLWIQLNGGAASHNHPEYRPYFVSEIMRLGLSVGLYDWRPFRQTLASFLWLQQYLRRHKTAPMT